MTPAEIFKYSLSEETRLGKSMVDSNNKYINWYWRKLSPKETSLDTSYYFYIDKNGKVDEDDLIYRFIYNEINLLWNEYEDDSPEKRTSHAKDLYKYIKDKLNKKTTK